MNDIDLRGEKGRLELFISAAFSCLMWGILIYNLYKERSQLTGNYEVLGFNVGLNMATPFMVIFALATVFNIIAFLKHSKPFALTCAVLYAVAIALLPVAYRNTISQAIICFIGYVRMQSVSEIAQRRAAEEEEELREYFHRRFPKSTKEYSTDEMRAIIARADEKKRLRKEREAQQD